MVTFSSFFSLIDTPYRIVALLVSLPVSAFSCMFNLMKSFRGANFVVKVS